MFVPGVKRGGYRLPGADKVFCWPLTSCLGGYPNEKPPLANGWLVTTWTERGMFPSLTLASRELYLEPAWR